MNLVVNRWKSGGANVDEYRRAIETQRMVQVVSQFADDAPFVLIGDVNADVRDGPQTPWSSQRNLPIPYPRTL
jgi:hypothetical protein